MHACQGASPEQQEWGRGMLSSKQTLPRNEKWEEKSPELICTVICASALWTEMHRHKKAHSSSANFRFLVSAVFYSLGKTAVYNVGDATAHKRQMKDG